MNVQVAVIDALEDFVLNWLLRHNLSWYVMACWIHSRSFGWY